MPSLGHNEFIATVTKGPPYKKYATNHCQSIVLTFALMKNPDIIFYIQMWQASLPLQWCNRRLLHLHVKFEIHLQSSKWNHAFRLFTVQVLWKPDACHSFYSGRPVLNTYGLLILRAVKLSYADKIHIFQCMGKIFCVKFERYPLNFTQNILPIHWKMQFLYHVENDSRAHTRLWKHM